MALLQAGLTFQQILTAWLHHLRGQKAPRGGLGRNRTADTGIFNPLLYRLSYQAWSRVGGEGERDGPFGNGFLRASEFLRQAVRLGGRFRFGLRVESLMKTSWLAAILLIAMSAPLAAQISARQAGAKGDGRTDDSAALQAALQSNASLRLEAGTYRLTRGLSIDLSKSGRVAICGDGAVTLIMEGEGAALSLLGHHGGTADPKSLKPEVWDTENTPSLSGFEIRGANPKACGVEASGCMQLSLHHVVVTRCLHAVRLHERNRNVSLAQCNLYHNSGIGVFLDAVNLHQINITGCHISYNRSGGVVSRGGNVRNLQIAGCDIEANQGLDDPPAANVELNSTDGSIGEVAISGCTLQHGSKAPGSANIRVLGAGSDPSLERRVGRPHTREGNISITGNVFSDVSVNIEVRQSRGVVISANTFWEGFEQDLLIEDSEHVLVQGNNFDRNPRYLVNGFDNSENNGLVLRRVSDSSISGNVIAGVWRKRAAIDAQDCQRLMLQNNQVLDSDGPAMRLENCRRCMVTGNMASDSREPQRSPAIEVVGSSADELGLLIQGNSP